MKNVYQNEKVKHSVHCSSVDCFLSGKEHVSVFHFDTNKVAYFAETLHDAAKMWVKGGQKELHNVGRVG